MTHRKCFLKIMAGDATSWTPNYELGCWGQTVQRWLDEGIPSERMYWNFWCYVPRNFVVTGDIL